MADRPVLLTVEETRSDLRVSRAKLYALIASGDLESVKIGRSRRIPSAAVERFVARRLAGGV